MSNTLSILSKDLRALSKKIKSLHFTQSLVITFLMTGILAKSNKLQLTNENIKSKINKTKSKNKAEISKKREFYDLGKLIDHATKPIWSALQFNLRLDLKNTSRKQNTNSKNFNFPEYQGANVQSNGGILTTEVGYVDIIDFGATIKPKPIGEKQIQKPNISVDPNISVNFSTPNPIEIPNFASIIVPPISPISVNSINSIGAISSITITEIPRIDVVLSKTTPPSTQKQNEIVIKKPTTPGTFNPTTKPTVSTPDAPNVLNVNVPNQPIITINVEKPESINTVTLTTLSSGNNPVSNRYYWLDGNDGVISQISLNDGSYYKTELKKVTIKGYDATAGIKALRAIEYPADTVNYASPSGIIPSTELQNITLTKERNAFMTLINSPYTYFGVNTKIAVKVDFKPVINLEAEEFAKVHLQALYNNGIIDLQTFNQANSYVVRAKNMGIDKDITITNDHGFVHLEGHIYHQSKGTIELLGNNSSYIFTTIHLYGDVNLYIMENTGKVLTSSHANNQMAYYHSPDYSMATSYGGYQVSIIYANSGEISLYGNESKGMVFTSKNDYLKLTDAAFINDGIVNAYAPNSIGIFIDNPANLSPQSGFITGTNGAIKLFGDNSIGVYIKNDNVVNMKNSVNLVIGEAGNIHTYTSINDLIENDLKISTTPGNEWVDNAVGIIVDHNGATSKIMVPSLEIKEYAQKSAGIYTKSGDIDIHSGATNSMIISGGKSNVGLYAMGGNITYQGTIDITGGEGNTAIYTDTQIINGSGDILINGNKSTGLFASNNTNSIINGNRNIVATSGSNNTAIYNNGGTVNAGDITFTNITNYGTGIYANNNSSTNAGNISISGGSDLSGLYTTGSSSTSVQNISISGTGKKNIGIFADTTGTTTILGSVSVSGTDGSIGIYANSNITANAGTISISGDESVGYLAKNGTITINNAGLIEISKNALGIFANKTVSANNVTINSKDNTSIGIFANQNTSIKELTGKAKIGVYTNGGTTNINKVTLDDIQSTGLYVNAGTLTISESTGNTLHSLSDSAIGIYNKGTFNGTGISISKTTGTTQDAIGVYATNATTNINNSSINLTNANVGIYASLGTLNATKSTIILTNSEDKGVGIYSNGATINLSGDSITQSTINVKNGISALASTGNTGGLITADYADITYDGEGYALYTEGSGEIKVQHSSLNLYGSAVGYGLDKDNPKVNLNGTTINVYSNDVIVVDLKNAGQISLSNIKSDVTPTVGSIISHGATNYKLAMVDGGELFIDENLDKSNTITESNANIFTRRLNLQKIKFLVGKDKNSSPKTVEVKAHLNENPININNPVVGLDITSSNTATSKNDTEIYIYSTGTINVNNTSATSGKGAVGLYINYGQITNEGTILVDVTNAQKNNAATGIYGVNGSILTNKNIITAKNTNSVGIFAQAMRTDGETEFDSTSTTLTVLNDTNGIISSLGKNGVGIFALNNGDKTAQDNVITNKGKIIVGDGEGDSSSVGIYGDKVKILLNDGEITVGENGVGVYVQNSTINDSGNLGTMNLGNKATGIIFDPTTSIIGGNALIITTTSTAPDPDSTGIYYQGKSNTTGTISIDVDGTNTKGLTNIYIQGKDVTSSGNLKVGENGVGLSIDNNNEFDGKITNTGIISLQNKDNAKGMFATGKHLTGNSIYNTGTINVNGSSSIGMIVTEESIADNLNGTINLTNQTNPANVLLGTDGVIGIYAENAIINNIGVINFNGTSETNKGVQLVGSALNVSSNINIATNHDKKNILIYGNAYNKLGIQKGNHIDITAIINVLSSASTPGSSVSGRTIGMYLDTASNDASPIYQNNLITFGTNGKMNVHKEGIGIYLKNDDSTAKNILKLQDTIFFVTDENSIGIYADGNIELQGNTNNGNIQVKDKAVGVFAAKGTVDITTNPLKINLYDSISTNAGIGMYLTNGSTLSGEAIDISSVLVNSSPEHAVGIYYAKGTATSGVDHTNKLTISDISSNKIILLYDKGINITNKNTFEISATTNSIATYIDDNATFTNDASGNIILNGSQDGGYGIYIGDGKAQNNGNISITDSISGTTQSVGILVSSKNGKNGIGINETSGNISITGNTIGMYIAGNGTGTNIGINKGIIESNTLDSTGVFVEGTGTFSNEGTINADSIGVYLLNTHAGRFNLHANNTGVLTLNTSQGIGVYADASIIDKDIDIKQSNATIKKTIALYAVGNSTDKTIISSTIKNNTSNEQIGIYVANDYVNFTSTANVLVAEDATGIYVDPLATLDITMQKITAGKGSIGLYLGNNGSNGANVGFSGELDIQKIGIFVDENATFRSKGSILNLNSSGTDPSIGIFVNENGTIYVGQNASEALTINVSGTGTGIGIYSKKGTINIGNFVTLTGPGTLLALEDSTTTHAANTTVSSGGQGIAATYTSGGTQAYTILNTGTFNLTGKTALNKGAQGISVKVEQNTSYPIDIKNSGNINLVSNTEKETVGIFSAGANILNDTTGVIQTGNKGIGIFATSKDESTDYQTNNTITNHGEIQLLGDESIGVYAVNQTSTNKGIGTIELGVIKSVGNANQTIGTYIKNTVIGDIKNGTLTLGDAGNGIILENVLGFGGTTSGKITIENTNILVGNNINDISPIGLNINESNVILKNTTVTTGEKGIGILTHGTTQLTIDDFLNPSGTTVSVKNGTYLYSKDNTSINLTTTSGSIFDIGNGSIGLTTLGSSHITASQPIILKVGNKSVGLYSDHSSSISANIDFDIQDGGTAFYITGSVPTISNLNNVLLNGDNAVGYYIGDLDGNAAINSQITINATKKGQVGIYTKNNTSTPAHYTLTNSNIITVNGDSNYGIYNTGNYALINTNDIFVGNSTPNDPLTNTFNSSVGIYSENGTTLTHTGNIHVGDNSVGIYGENIAVTVHDHTTSITNTGNDAISLFVKNGSLEVKNSAQQINVGDNAGVGIYVEESTADIQRDIIIGMNNSVGVYSKGSKDIIVSKNISISDDSIGIYKTGSGKILATGTTINVGDKGYGIYYKGDNVTNKSTNQIISTSSYILNAEAIGIFAENASVIQNGNITVGRTTYSDANDPTTHTNSIGIFASSSDIQIQSGIINISNPFSVGIYGANSETKITIDSGATINVSNGSYGIMAKDGTKVINDGVINVDGLDSTVGTDRANKASIGIAGYGTGTEIHNKGTIDVKNGAIGIYVAGGAKIINTGTISIDASSTGIKIGNGGENETGKDGISGAGEAVANVGGAGSAGQTTIEIGTDGTGKVTVGSYLINSGEFKTVGSLYSNNMILDLEDKNTVLVSATNGISGTFEVTPSFAYKSNQLSYIIREVFSPGNLSSGGTIELKSQSVSWMGKIVGNDVIMAKILYQDLIAGGGGISGIGKYENLALGLDDLYIAESSKPGTVQAEMFNALDALTTKEELATAVSNLRGDMYSNSQSRMLDIDRAFNKAYDELINSKTSTKDMHKVTVITTKGEFSDETTGVAEYNYDMYGVLYLKDKEYTDLGSKLNWTFGFTGTQFKISDEINKGSKENVISLKIGAHYQKPILNSFRFLTRFEGTANYHLAERIIDLNNGNKYSNTANYASATISSKNKVSYILEPIQKLEIKPYGAVNLGYSKAQKISEQGDGILLEVQLSDYLSLAPELGVETEYPLIYGHKFNLTTRFDASYSHELGDVYKGNKARIKETVQDYYELSEPDKEKGVAKLGAELAIDKNEELGLTFRAEYKYDKGSTWNYGLRLNMKF